MTEFVLGETTRALEMDGAAGGRAEQVHLSPQNRTLTDAPSGKCRGKWLHHREKERRGAICPRGNSCQGGGSEVEATRVTKGCTCFILTVFPRTIAAKVGERSWRVSKTGSATQPLEIPRDRKCTQPGPGTCWMAVEMTLASEQKSSQPALGAMQRG